MLKEANLFGTQAGVYWSQEIFSISVALVALVLPKISWLQYTSATKQQQYMATGTIVFYGWKMPSAYKYRADGL